MTSFGERLRREREMRSVSLDEIADATKIGTRLLKALEEEQFELLPGGIFNKGFVRAYAKYLGINEEQAVADYLQAAGESQLDVRVIAQQNERPETIYGDSERSHYGFPFVPVVILLAIVGAAFAGWKLYQQRMQERETSAAVESTSVPAQSANGGSTPAITPSESGSPAASSQSNVPGSGASRGTEQASSKPPGISSGSTQIPASTRNNASTTTGGNTGENAGRQFEVAVRTNGRAWVSIKADGEIKVRGIITSDQVKTIRASNEIVVWTGNAGATQVSFDGAAVPVEGGVNDVKVLVFKPDGLQPERKPVVHPAGETVAQPDNQPAPAPQ
jgi:cytoskeleton protein RodZ